MFVNSMQFKCKGGAGFSTSAIMCKFFSLGQKFLNVLSVAAVPCYDI